MGIVPSLRKQIFDLWDENPLLSAKMICKLLDLCYKKRKQLIWKYHSQWRTSQKKQIGSKCQKPSFHKPSAWVYVDKLKLQLEHFLERGWIQTKAKNKYLMFKSPGYGHMKYFPTTGRVNIHTIKPHSRGRLFQLFCNGFSMNGLIDSMQILDQILKSIRFKGAHAVFSAPDRLPYMEIKMFQLSNGITIKLGDRSHPNGIEVEYCYPDWAEKNEQLLSKIYEGLNPPKRLNDKKDPRAPFYVQ